MKKVLSITLILVMIFAFAGCKKDKPSGQGLAPNLETKIGKKSVYVETHETSWAKKGYTYEKSTLEEIIAKKKISNVKFGDELTVDFGKKQPSLVTFKAHLLKIGDKDVTAEDVNELVITDFKAGKATVKIENIFKDFITENYKDSAKKEVVIGYTLECTFDDNDKCEYAFAVKAK